MSPTLFIAPLPLPGRRTLIAAVLVWLALAVLQPNRVWAQPTVELPLAAAGNGRDLFIAQPTDKDSFQILTHSAGDPAGRLTPAGKLVGKLAPGGLTASDSAVWVIYQDQTVQSIALTHLPADHPSTTKLRLGSPRTWPDLPRGAQPRAFAASSQGLWVLVHVQDQDALDAIDQLNEANEGELSSENDDQGAQGAQAAQAAQADRPANKDEASRTAGPGGERAVTDEPRILELSNNRWRSHRMPEGWVDSGRVWLIAPPQDAARPWLVSHDVATNELVWWTAQGANRWTSPIRLAHSAALEPAMAAVQDQLVIAQRLRDQPASQISLSVIRPRSISPLSALTFDVEREPARWWLIAFDQAAAVILADDAGNRLLGEVDLQGQVVKQPTLMAVEPPSPWVGVEYLILVLVLAATTVSVVVFSRRDPEGNRLELPAHLVVAPLPLRLAAGIFDLTPAVILTAWLFDVDFGAVWAPQTADTPDPAQLWPPLTATVLFVLYTTIAEAITATTAGKVIFRLRVTTMKGDKPKFGPMLTRNLMKACDLFVIPLLIVALLSPYRQRFGDLLARTVVAMDQVAPAEGRDGAGNASRSPRDDDQP